MANSEYEHALQHLREKHVRLTPQRKLILHYLINHHTHPSVEMIYADLKPTTSAWQRSTTPSISWLKISWSLN